MGQRKYATQQLGFFCCGEINENTPELIQSLMRSLVSSRMWACSPPVFVDTTDEVEPNNQYGAFLSEISAVRSQSTLPTRDSFRLIWMKGHWMTLLHWLNRLQNSLLSI